jgi:hypothetical protein
MVAEIELPKINLLAFSSVPGPSRSLGADPETGEFGRPADSRNVSHGEGLGYNSSIAYTKSLNPIDLRGTRQKTRSTRH